jgi:hypothetical protein
MLYKLKKVINKLHHQQRSFQQQHHLACYKVTAGKSQVALAAQCLPCIFPETEVWLYLSAQFTVKHSLRPRKKCDQAGQLLGMEKDGYK